MNLDVQSLVNICQLLALILLVLVPFLTVPLNTGTYEKITVPQLLSPINLGPCILCLSILMLLRSQIVKTSDFLNQ